MCGRFVLYSLGSMLAEHFQLDRTPALEPRYNIAPSQPIAVVRQDPDSLRRDLGLIRWGLIPSWAKDPAVGYKMINAKSETAATKPAFRAAFRRRRCLVPTDGFYEWLRIGTGKQPFFFRMNHEGPFAFAGLWERWTAPSGETVESGTILTTSANDIVRPVHDRMPVIVAPEDYSLWLDASKNAEDELRPILAPYAAKKMTAYLVSSYVNKPVNEGPECIEPHAG